MKKYTNNVFLNNLNDFTRSAYAVDNTIQSTQFDKDIVINREMDSNLFVQQKKVLITIILILIVFLKKYKYLKKN